MTLRYLLDTHAAVWLLEGNEKLGEHAKAALRAEESVAISDITLFEVALLAKRGMILLKPNTAVALEEFATKLHVLPITARIAADATTVNLPHRDPFDRIITATAIAHGLTLVTKDRQIVDASVVRTLW